MKRMEVMGKNKKSTVNQNTNDLTVYKVGAAFALLVLALLALGRILNVYATAARLTLSTARARRSGRSA